MGTAPSDLSGLSERIGAVLALDPTAPVVESGRWWTWGELGATVAAVADLVPERGTPVGLILRNRPAAVGLLLGVLRAGGCAVAINPERGVDRTRGHRRARPADRRRRARRPRPARRRRAAATRVGVAELGAEWRWSRGPVVRGHRGSRAPRCGC